MFYGVYFKRRLKKFNVLKVRTSRSLINKKQVVCSSASENVEANENLIETTYGIK